MKVKISNATKNIKIFSTHLFAFWCLNFLELVRKTLKWNSLSRRRLQAYSFVSVFYMLIYSDICYRTPMEGPCFSTCRTFRCNVSCLCKNDKNRKFKSNKTRLVSLTLHLDHILPKFGRIHPNDERPILKNLWSDNRSCP